MLQSSLLSRENKFLSVDSLVLEEMHGELHKYFAQQSVCTVQTSLGSHLVGFQEVCVFSPTFLIYNTKFYKNTVVKTSSRLVGSETIFHDKLRASYYG